MSEPWSPTGEMPVPQPCTAMHPTGSRGGGLIPESDGAHTSKLPYTCVCNQPCCLGIRGHTEAYIGTERCTVHDALLSGVVA